MAGRQQGLAIITVLLIIALMVTLLGFMVEQQHLLIRRLSNQNVAEQGFQLARGVDEWAARVLHDDVNRFVDYWDEDWALMGAPPEKLDDAERESFSLRLSSQEEREPLPTIDFGVDTLSYKISDLQGRYNLNNLAVVNPQSRREQKKIFLNLLEQLEVGEFDERERLHGALVDWLDENDLAGPNGAESGAYQSRDIPYFAADQKLVTLGELRFIEGFTREVINQLEPHVTVLPVVGTRININTTSTAVMASLSSSVIYDTESVDAFLAQRLDPAFLGFQPDQLQAAQTAIIGTSVAEGGFIRNMLQTNSQFFQIASRVVLGDYVYCAYTTVLRESPSEGDSSSPGIIILNRHYNTICNEIVH